MLRAVMGARAGDEGDHAAAETQLTDGLDAAQQSQDPFTIVWLLGSLGLAALMAGRLAEARSRFELVFERAIAEGYSAWEAIGGLAGVAAASGDDRRAAILYGACRIALDDPAAHANTSRIYGRLSERFLEPLRA